MAEPSVPTPSVPPTSLGPAVDSRTELQVQLAFLAIHLVELSQDEEGQSLATVVQTSGATPWDSSDSF